MRFALAGGLLAFLALGGAAALDPLNIGWLLRTPDSATGYLGWQFFRQAPLAQVPLGSNPSYGMEIASSVVFSDSIPLLALAFKPFTPVLPPAFQYVGLWLLGCFVLQALFAYRLLLRFTDRAFAAVGIGFFVLAPVLLHRLPGHAALFAQWIVLAALGLYFSSPWRPRAWLVLLAAAALVHFYLFAMAAALAAADLWQRRLQGALQTLPAARQAAIAAATVVAVMWVAGYFAIGGSAFHAEGFGHYRMNLLALIDPGTRGWQWSLVLPDRPGGEGDYEGFNYLGLGVLLLMPFAAYAALRAKADRAAAVPLVAVSLVLTLLALSPRVGLGDVELLHYPVPAAVLPATDLVRASGRMFWPVYYLIILAVLVAAWRHLPRRAALGVLGLALLVQIADSAPALRAVRERLGEQPAWSSPLRSPFWPEIASRYKRVIQVLPTNEAETFVPLALYAAAHGMAINFGYFARVDTEQLIAARLRTEAAVLGNRLDPESLYVFRSTSLWNLAVAQARAEDLVGVVDGLRVIAPRLRLCEACDRAALAEIRPEPFAGYALGTRLGFARGADGRRHAVLGWSPAGDWGVWSQARSASLVLGLTQPPPGDLVLELEARASRAGQELALSLNGVPLGTVLYASERVTESKAFAVPHAVAATGNKVAILGFKSTDPLGVVALRLSAAPDTAGRSADSSTAPAHAR